MTEAENAKQIYDKFYAELYALTELRPRVAKQLSIIHVEGIIEAIRPHQTSGRKVRHYESILSELKSL